VYQKRCVPEALDTPFLASYAWAMDVIPLKPERQAQLEEYAHRRGQDPAVALDEALAAYLEWERQDFEEAVEGIRRGHEDVKAGRTGPAADFLSEMRRKHGISR
jgi:predicted transcriptional regulator